MTALVGEQIRLGGWQGQARALDFLLVPVQGNGFHEVVRGVQNRSETEPTSPEASASLLPHWTLCYKNIGQTKNSVAY